MTSIPYIRITPKRGSLEITWRNPARYVYYGCTRSRNLNCLSQYMREEKLIEGIDPLIKDFYCETIRFCGGNPEKYGGLPRGKPKDFYGFPAKKVIVAVETSSISGAID